MTPEHTRIGGIGRRLFALVVRRLEPGRQDSLFTVLDHEGLGGAWRELPGHVIDTFLRR